MPFAIALAVSAVLHAAAIAMPGWTLPGDAEAEPPLEAWLAPAAATAPAPAPAAAPVPRKRSHPRPQRPPARAAAEEAAPSASMGTTQPDTVDAAAATAEPEILAPAAAAVPPPAVPPWPAQGRLRYVVKYGEGGFIIGETVQEWRVADGRYSIRSVAEPKGLAALRGRTRVQTSEGEVTAAGLQPREFRDQREGRDAEVATFDRPARLVTFSGGRPPAQLVEGTEDMISVFYQLAWLAPRQSVELAVATGSRVGRWTFEWLGEETLALPSGEIATLHLRTRADGDTTEVWLAPGYGGLPVRIRYADRKGDAFEQTADLTEKN